MRTILLGALAAGLGLAAAGCAYNPIVGDGASRTDRFYGDVGITGDGSTVSILRGSKVHKLSIVGNECNVTVEDDVTLYKIEFWGKANTVSIPEHLVVRTAQVGTNQIIRRPHELRTPPGWNETSPTPWPPPTAPAPETRFEPTAPAEETGYESTAPIGDEFPYAPPPTMQPQDEPPRPGTE